MCIARERRIASHIVTNGLNKGYTVSVNDGVEWVVKHSRDHSEIMRSLESTGQDVLLFRCDGKRIGVVLLVWGNGEDLVADCTDNTAITAIVGF